MPVNGLVAAGGLPERNQLLMQIYADVTGREIKVVGTTQAGALGSAMHGAVAAGAAPAAMTPSSRRRHAWRTSRMRSTARSPDKPGGLRPLYREYVTLHDYFGRGANDVMKRLKALRAEVLASR